MKINNSRQICVKKTSNISFFWNTLILKNNFKTKLGLRSIFMSDNIQLTRRT